MIVQVRELKSHLMFGFLAIILLFGNLYPALGQSSPLADHIVINEVENNPPGDDSKTLGEWIELYNPTDMSVDVGGWTIGATSGLKLTYKIPEGTKISSGGFLTYTYGPLWFPDISATVQLKSKNGTVIDQTPLLRDIENGFKSWQRTADGLDTDSATDWTFKLANAGSSNGKLSSTVTEAGLSIMVSTDKTGYIFGEAIKITGQVSKKISVANQPYTPEKVTVVISGPTGFQKTVTLYPDTARFFKTEMKTDEALNVPEGDYRVSVKYGSATSTTQFALGEKAFIPPQKEASAIISIHTDKLSYIPGEKATISANTSKIIPFTGMQFKVFDPNKKQVYDGTLYPDTQGQFSVKIFINTVNPVYGKYNIIATYDTETTQTSYELVPEIKEDTLISLATDKAAYGLGDTVIITGRSNKVWIASFDIEIVQAFAKKDIIDTVKIKDIVRLEGDGTFKYEVKIPNKTDRYGDYKVTVSKEIGSAQTFFKVVENPNEFVVVESGPLSISTDKLFYNIGDPLVVTGKVTETKDFGRQTVKISITKDDGTQIISKGDPRASAGKNQEAVYSFTGVPDNSGNFEIKSTIYRNIFEKGTYLLKATYGDLVASTSFTVEDILDLGAGVKIIASTNKEVYGVSEEVKLTGKVSTFTAQSSYQIILTDPNGKTTSDSVLINKGLFSWSWIIPDYTTTFGIYKITVRSDSDEVNVFIKISKDPATEIAPLPLVVETDKAMYSTGETITVFGSAIRKVSGTEGLVVNVRPEIVVKNEANKELAKALVDLNAGGKFQTSFKLVPVVYKTGEYKIIAKYYNEKSQTVFKVDDRFVTGVDAPLILLVETDKDKYLSGETVKITGRTNKITSAFDVDITVSDNSKSVPTPVTVRFDPSGSFNYDYKISDNAKLGSYTVTADTDFYTVSDTFEVVSELPPVEIEEPTKETPTEPIPTPKKIVDKVNRVTKSSMQITIGEKSVENATFTPRVFDGLLRVNSGDESAVNIKVTTEDGTCLIGQGSNCKITKSTRSDTSLYQIVNIDGTNLKVRYSGAGTILEKFTILPEDPDGTLPDGNWNVEIIKNNQISRFYYKISYTATQ